MIEKLPFTCILSSEIDFVIALEKLICHHYNCCITCIISFLPQWSTYFLSFIQTISITFIITFLPVGACPIISSRCVACIILRVPLNHSRLFVHEFLFANQESRCVKYQQVELVNDNIQ